MTTWNKTSKAISTTSAVLGSGWSYVKGQFKYVSVGGVDLISLFGALGSGYTVGNVLTIVGGNSNATCRVTSIGVGGIITGLTVVTPGTGYTSQDTLALTGGTGTGGTCTIFTDALYYPGTLTENNTYAFTLTYVGVADIVISLYFGGGSIDTTVGGGSGMGQWAPTTAYPNAALPSFKMLFQVIDSPISLTITEFSLFQADPPQPNQLLGLANWFDVIKATDTFYETVDKAAGTIYTKTTKASGTLYSKTAKASGSTWIKTPKAV